MGQKIIRYRRLSRAWHGLTLFIISLVSTSAYSAGLGALTLQSGSGEPLSVHIALVSEISEVTSTSCVKARLLSSDGVPIAVPQIAVSYDTLGSVIALSLHEPLTEPVMIISVVAGCEQPVQRDYHVLLDTRFSLIKYDMKNSDTESGPNKQNLAPKMRHSLQLSYELTEPRGTMKHPAPISQPKSPLM